MKENLKYFDVDSKAELPKLSEGQRYMICFGQSETNYRAYIVPKSMSRLEFMEKYPEYISNCNKEVYKHNGIVVRQDPKLACPAFYIVALYPDNYRSFAVMSDEYFLRFSFILKKIRNIMKKDLNISYIDILSNETAEPYMNVHFWLMPIFNGNSNNFLDFSNRQYLESFVPKEEIEKLNEYNDKMLNKVQQINLKKLDDEVTNTLIPQLIKQPIVFKNLNTKGNQILYNEDDIVVNKVSDFKQDIFTITVEKDIKSIDDMDDISFIKLSFVLKKLKEQMEKELGIKYAYLLYDDNPNTPLTIGLLPIDGVTSPDLLDLNLKEYLGL